VLFPSSISEAESTLTLKNKSARSASNQHKVKMSASNSKPARLSRQRIEEDRKLKLSVIEPEPISGGDDGEVEVEDPCLETERMERRLVRKIDIRLCTIAGVLCSLNLLDRFEPSRNLSHSEVLIMSFEVGLFRAPVLRASLRILDWGWGIDM
jgi:hypothetical protein